MKVPKITVVGSINMDMVIQTDRAPEQGETVLGRGFQMIPGGKGANQAVAAARLGADVTMIGAVGDDPFADVLLSHLRKEGLRVDDVEPVTGCATGVASIVLSEGDNRIIVAPGANAELSKAQIDRVKPTLQDSDLVVMQLEIPLEIVECVTGYCSEHGVPVLLNPAPAMALSEKLLGQISYLTPNESEEQALRPYATLSDEQWIVTMGSRGVRFMENGEERTVGGYATEVVDTTGAGDTFNGALATELAKGSPLKEAIEFANAAAALSITRLGAQTGMPKAEDVHAFMKKMR
ncbi:ribokinase [Salisediminibacterium selenitireducens]|uniref:Ribokinase n=1 Tax=Bacillus selenitireducens (strain ATCC 700615 / DSM 15326 / MLS10) TaxID=439292 RepID=D6XZQ7_BACIE|nr:ribokinase [Salisediminibacterium selenitireducens]ADH98431.1 ribokinase [[Bacillus] selenitireducens MLS10]